MKCRTCSVVILPATAKRTAGLCLSCATKADPALVEKVADRQGSTSDRKEGLGKQVLALITVLLLGGTFMLFALIAKIVASLIAVLIARFVFETTWNSAFFAGAITYLVLGFIGLLLEDWPMKRFRSKRKTSKE